MCCSRIIGGCVPFISELYLLRLHGIHTSLPTFAEPYGTLMFDLEAIGESKIRIGQRSTVTLARH